MTSLRLFARGGARGLATSVRETPPAAVTTRAEQLMQRAMAEGHFENLAGAGKPLPARGAEAPRVRLSGAQLLSQRAESERREGELASTWSREEIFCSFSLKLPLPSGLALEVKPMSASAIITTEHSLSRRCRTHGMIISSSSAR